MEIHELASILDSRLTSIEDNQKEHSKATTERLEDINKTCATLVVKVDNVEAINKDQETRLRNNEKMLTKVAVFFSGMSVMFGSIVAWAVDKLMSNGS